MAQEHMFEGTGWGVVGNHDLGAMRGPLVSYAKTADEEDISGPSSPAAGAALPPDLVAAFLQSHRSNADTAAALAQAGPHHHVSSSPQQPAMLRTSSLNSDADGEALLLPNPFALNHGNSNMYPSLPQQQQQQQQQHAAVKGATAPRLQQQQQPKRKRSFLQRLWRGLVWTSASAGLMALGAWGGSIAYRHYMAQLDDRDQLARRVSDLQKQEEKLVLRCTAVEQDRQNLAAQLADASSALSEGSAARSRLQQQLAQSQADREETVRLNLNLQRKLSVLEEQHASLSAVHKEKLVALDVTLVEAARLDREVDKLQGALEKVEARVGALEAANAELKRENAALAAAAQKGKTHKS